MRVSSRHEQLGVAQMGEPQRPPGPIHVGAPIRLTGEHLLARMRIGRPGRATWSVGQRAKPAGLQPRLAANTNPSEKRHA